MVQRVTGDAEDKPDFRFKNKILQNKQRNKQIKQYTLNKTVFCQLHLIETENVDDNICLNQFNQLQQKVLVHEIYS